MQVLVKSALEKGAIFGPYPRNQNESILKILKKICSQFDGSGSKGKILVDPWQDPSTEWMGSVRTAKSEKEQNLSTVNQDDEVYFQVTKVISSEDELLVWLGLEHEHMLEISDIKNPSEISNYNCDNCKMKRINYVKNPHLFLSHVLCCSSESQKITKDGGKISGLLSPHSNLKHSSSFTIDNILKAKRPRIKKDIERDEINTHQNNDISTANQFSFPQFSNRDEFTKFYMLYFQYFQRFLNKNSKINGTWTTQIPSSISTLPSTLSPSYSSPISSISQSMGSSMAKLPSGNFDFSIYGKSRFAGSSSPLMTSTLLPPRDVDHNPQSTSIEKSPFNISPDSLKENRCAKCQTKFRMTSDLVYHMRVYHRSEFFNQFSGISTYTNNQHLSKIRNNRHFCKLCGEGFKEKHHLTRHMVAHKP